MIIFFSNIESFDLYIFSGIKQETEAPSEKKVKNDVKDEVDSALDSKIEKQNKEYFKLRDTLQASTNKHDWLYILNANKQSKPDGNSEVK